MMKKIIWLLSLSALTLSSLSFARQADQQEGASVPPTKPPAPVKDIVLSYKGYFLGLPMLSNRVSVTQTPHTYHMQADFQTSGLAAWFKKNHIQAKASGRWMQKPGTGFLRPRPESYHHVNLASRKNRHVGIVFTREGARPDIRPPFGSQGDPPPTPEQLRTVLDPLSAMLALIHGGAGTIASPCQGFLRVFDGKQRYDLSFVEKGWEQIRVKAYKGKALHCYVYYHPVAGFDPEDLADKETYEKPIHVWLKPFEGGALYLPVKFQIRLKGWTGIVEAQTLSVKMGGEAG